jgi:hypothetical protein
VIRRPGIPFRGRPRGRRDGSVGRRLVSTTRASGPQVKQIVSCGASGKMIGDQERLLSASGTTWCRGTSTSVKLGAKGGHAQCIAYRVLSRINTNTPIKGMGWKEPKGEGRGGLGDVAERTNKKAKKKKRQKSTSERRSGGD